MLPLNPEIDPLYPSLSKTVNTRSKREREVDERESSDEVVGSPREMERSRRVAEIVSSGRRVSNERRDLVHVEPDSIVLDDLGQAVERLRPPCLRIAGEVIGEGSRSRPVSSVSTSSRISIDELTRLVRCTQFRQGSADSTSVIT
jgi:hypothetical protein